MSFLNPLKIALIVTLLATNQPQVCHTQFFYPGNTAEGGSISRASSTASERQLELGGLGLSQGVVSSQTVTRNNGGYDNGGTTSLSSSRARTGEVSLGGLDIGSTLTRSKTSNNGAVSRSLSHDLNVGGLGVGTSLSRDNLQNGFGLQRSPNGGVQLGLGALNVDLSRNRQQQQSGALTQAQAQAEGVDAFARANSNAATQSRQLGLLGFTNSRSQSNAISGTQYGQTSASTGGLAGANSQRIFPRFKRRAQFSSFLYSDNEFIRSRREFGTPLKHNFQFPQQQNIKAQGLAHNKNVGFKPEADANGQSKHELNKKGLFQHNAASSIDSNLATDGSSGQVSSTNANQQNSLANDGTQSTNNAKSQALNIEQHHQRAFNANAGTKEIKTTNGERQEGRGTSQATNSNQFGTSSNRANTNSVADSQADSSSQSIVQGNNGQNSVASTNANVNSVQRPNGFSCNTASRSASVVGQVDQSGNAVASNSNEKGGFGSRLTTADGFTDGNVGKTFSNFDGAKSFASGRFRG